MMCGCYGNGLRLIPEAKMKAYERPPERIPRSPGHHQEWIAACKTGSDTTCHFDYSGAITESVLLGNIAFRTGCKLEWDATEMNVTNCPQANDLLQRPYRQGWTL